MILHPHTRIPHGREVPEGRRKKTREKERERERAAMACVRKRAGEREREREREYSCMGRLLNKNIPHAKTYFLGQNLGLTVR